MKFLASYELLFCIFLFCTYTFIYIVAVVIQGKNRGRKGGKEWWEDGG